MEKIYQHIEKLLAQHDYVVVPGLGGFIVQMESAKFLFDRITPPLATIGFNPLMLHADGLLAIEIARTEQISYRMAMEYIEREVDAIKSKLLTNGNVLIGNLGFLEQSPGGSLVFNPIYKAGFLPQNFGLSDLYISTRKANLSPAPERKISIPMPSGRSFKYAAAILVLFGLFISSNKVSDVRHLNNAGFASLPMVNAPTYTPAIDTVSLATIKSDSIDSVALNNKFHVIVASLPTKELADKFCNELKSEKFNEVHELSGNKRCRVAIKSFANRKEAIEYMEFIRLTDTRFESAWVFCN